MSEKEITGACYWGDNDLSDEEGDELQLKPRVQLFVPP